MDCVPRAFNVNNDDDDQGFRALKGLPLLFLCLGEAV